MFKWTCPFVHSGLQTHNGPFGKNYHLAGDPVDLQAHCITACRLAILMIGQSTMWLSNYQNNHCTHSFQMAAPLPVFKYELQLKEKQ